MREDIVRHKKRTAILVLGMHRSGTSALTRCLNILGVALPERLMKSAPANPLGHFEPEEIVSIHEKLLNNVGSSWSDWSAFPNDWYQSNAREVIVSELIEAIDVDYAENDVFCVKDPRLVRFIPLWRDLLSGLHIEPMAVIPYRNPIEVAFSLKKRDQFPIEHGILLWMRHVLDAEYQSRGMPRHFISYERLLENKQISIYQLIESLPVMWPRRTAKAFDEINDFLDTKLRRHTASIIDLAFHKEIPAEVHEIYQAYEQLSADPQNIIAMDKLDVLRADFERTSGLMASTFRQLRERFESDNALFISNNEQVTSLVAQANLHHQDLAAARERADALVERVTQQDQHLAAAHERVDALIEQVARQDQHLAAAHERVDALIEQVARQGERLNQSVNALATFETKLGIASGEISVFKHAIKNQSNIISILQHSIPPRIGDLLYIQDLHSESIISTIWQSKQKKFIKLRRQLFIKSGLFDPNWYRETYKIDKKSNPLDHFVKFGSKNGYSPSPLFDAQWYIETNPDTVEQGIDPLTHYLTFGQQEGRPPLKQIVSNS